MRSWPYCPREPPAPRHHIDFPAVAPPTPNQLAWRGRIEALIRIVRPGLDLVLATGDRLSKVVEPADLDWTPPRAVSSPTTPARVGPGPARTPSS